MVAIPEINSTGVFYDPKRPFNPNNLGPPGNWNCKVAIELENLQSWDLRQTTKLRDYLKRTKIWESKDPQNYITVDFSMSLCIATSRLVYNCRYIRKLLQLSKSLEIVWFGRLYLLTEAFTQILIDLTAFWLQYSTSDFENPPLWTSLWRFVKGSIRKCRFRKLEQSDVSSFWSSSREYPTGL